MKLFNKRCPTPSLFASTGKTWCPSCTAYTYYFIDYTEAVGSRNPYGLSRIGEPSFRQARCVTCGCVVTAKPVEDYNKKIREDENWLA